ncbi:MAG: four helix bundle protein [Ignavibacteriae bacterium]|nr:four helix bundle protein [Ignavibacteriota bacterium]
MSASSDYFKKDLKKRIYDLVLSVLKKIESQKFSGPVYFRISDQLTRSITSIISNYVEGQAGSSKKDFENFLNYSLKSANESKLWITILRDINKLDSKDSEKFLVELDEVSKIIASILIKSRGKK